MPYLRDVRACILHAYKMGLIDSDECILMYEANDSGNLDIPYWKYNAFDLESLTDDESKGEFRFYKADIRRLEGVLGLPQQIVFYNGMVIDSIEALCIY